MAVTGKDKKEASATRIKASDISDSYSIAKESRGIDRIEMTLSSAIARLNKAVDGVNVAFGPVIREGGNGIAADEKDPTSASRIDEAMRRFNDGIDIIECRLLDLASRSAV